MNDKSTIQGLSELDECDYAGLDDTVACYNQRSQRAVQSPNRVSSYETFTRALMLSHDTDIMFTEPMADLESSSAATPVHSAWDGSDEMSEIPVTINYRPACEPCYAKLIFRCLVQAPNRRLSLQHIYEWMKDNSQKAAGTDKTGWKNSVRHNLSLNAAFERADVRRNSSARNKTPASSRWRLADNVLYEADVRPTTQYRDPSRTRRAMPRRRGSARPQVMHPRKAASGAKGGQASRQASNRHKQDPRATTSHVYSPSWSIGTPAPRMYTPAYSTPSSYVSSMRVQTLPVTMASPGQRSLTTPRSTYQTWSNSPSPFYQDSPQPMANRWSPAPSDLYKNLTYLGVEVQMNQAGPSSTNHVSTQYGANVALEEDCFDLSRPYYGIDADLGDSILDQ